MPYRSSVSVSCVNNDEHFAIFKRFIYFNRSFPGLLTYVNCYSVKLSTKVQDFFTYGKLIAIATIVITGFVQLAQGNTQHFTFENTETDFAKIALSFYSALFAYNGWNYLNFGESLLISLITRSNWLSPCPEQSLRSSRIRIETCLKPSSSHAFS